MKNNKGLHENKVLLVVKCIDDKICGENGDFTLGKQYAVIEILGKDTYCLVDDVLDRNYVGREYFEIIKDLRNNN